MAVDVKPGERPPPVQLLPPSSVAEGTRYLQLSYGKVNLVSFVKVSQKSSQQLMSKLDDLAQTYAGCVDVVSVNLNYWVDRMYLRVASLDLPYTRLLQDSNRANLWSANAVNESDTVLLFSRNMEPLCAFNLRQDFNQNVTQLVFTLQSQVEELLKRDPPKTPHSKNPSTNEHLPS
jgi:hypothetical protein